MAWKVWINKKTGCGLASASGLVGLVEFHLRDENRSSALHNPNEVTMPTYNAIADKDCQQKIIGNRCGHDRFAPNFFLYQGKPQSKVIHEMREKCQSAFFKPNKILPSLRHTTRQMRSESREAALNLAQIILTYMDFETGVIKHSIERIAGFAGYNYIRAKRAISALVKSGYVRRDRQYFYDKNGQKRGIPWRRMLTPKFYMELLGVGWVKWFNLKEFKRKQNEKKLNKRLKNSGGALKDMVKTISSFSKSQQPKFIGNKVVVSKEELEIKRNQIQEALRLFNLDPSVPISEYLKRIMEGL